MEFFCLAKSGDSRVRNMILTGPMRPLNRRAKGENQLSPSIVISVSHFAARALLTSGLWRFVIPLVPPKEALAII